MNKYKPPIRNSQSDVTYLLGSGVATLLCLLSKSWLLAVICIVIFILYIFVFIKHKKNETKVDEVLSELVGEEEANAEISLTPLSKIKSERQKERENADNYLKYLESIDAEFGNDEDYLDEFDMDEDKENN